MGNIEQTFKNLLHKIPGYAGYEEQEQRRDTDKRLRMYLAEQFRGGQQALTRLGERVVDAGRLDLAEQIGTVSQALDRFIARLETAPHGYTGWFEQVAIDEAALDQIYEFDAALADQVPLLHEKISHAAAQAPDGEGITQALEELRDLVDALNIRFDSREQLLAAGKQPA